MSNHNDALGKIIERLPEDMRRYMERGYLNDEDIATITNAVLDEIGQAIRAEPYWPDSGKEAAKRVLRIIEDMRHE